MGKRRKGRVRRRSKSFEDFSAAAVEFLVKLLLKMGRKKADTFLNKHTKLKRSNLIRKCILFPFFTIVFGILIFINWTRILSFFTGLFN